MTLKELEGWAQSQIENTATPEVRPDIGVSVLQLIDQVERLQNRLRELEGIKEEPGDLNWEILEIGKKLLALSVRG
ncbi:MAG: hypothetical protein KME26_11385 [Oscillatoria princeps RMCB-10]|jgi:hypothetical protein|nr:hypothetical protein [Oscillatoria princeps RMCB-10]